MTDKEWIEILPTATNKEIMECLDYFGYDSYYRTCREPLVAEITKRLNQLTEKDKRITELEAQVEQLVYLHNEDVNTIKLLNEQIAELEKRNAELKSDNDARKFAMAMSEKVEKKLREEITKAKEIIREYMRFEPVIGTCSFYSEEYEKTKKKAEAFLKE